jgi:hypothetical protein
VKNPLKITMPEYKFDTLQAQLKNSMEQPFIEYTQGGSSRKGGGAKVAGVDASVRQKSASKQAGGALNGRADRPSGVSGSKRASR